MDISQVLYQCLQTAKFICEKVNHLALFPEFKDAQDALDQHDIRAFDKVMDVIKHKLTEVTI